MLAGIVVADVAFAVADGVAVATRLILNKLTIGTTRKSSGCLVKMDTSSNRLTNLLSS